MNEFWGGLLWAAAWVAIAGVVVSGAMAQQPPAVPPLTAAQMQVNVMKTRVASDKDDLARSQGMVAASTALLAADEAALAKLEVAPAAAVTPAPNHLTIGSPNAVTIDHGVSRPGYVPPAAGAKR